MKKTLNIDEINELLKGKKIIEVNGLAVDESEITITLEDGVNYIGKILTIRSPMYCKEKGSIYCTTCVGEIMKDYKKGFSLLSTEVSGIMLNASLKSMHNAVVKTMKFNINEAIS